MYSRKYDLGSIYRDFIPAVLVHASLVATYTSASTMTKGAITVG